MKAVILVAGASRRLLSYTAEVPKCLLEVGGKTILDYQLDAIEELGITEVIIVTGYRREQVHEALAARAAGLHITPFVNHQFFDTNTAYSLALAREAFAGEQILYMNGDVLFLTQLLRRVQEAAAANPMAVERKRCGDEEVKVIVNDGGRILEVGKELDPAASLGEFIGVARFDAAFTTPFADALDRVIAAGERTAYFERALDLLAADHPLHAIDVTDLPCIEIDFPADLQKAREMAREFES